MDEIRRAVQREVILVVSRSIAQLYAPAAVSSRHIHISPSDLKRLFGVDYSLKALRNLAQPGQFACAETVTLVGSKNSIEKVRIVGPVRADTQVEISITDAFKLGVEPVIRMSGDIKGTPGIKIQGPAGEITLSCGVIVAARHLHISEEEAAVFGIKNGESVCAKKKGARGIVFENVVVRCGKEHRLEFHIDTDEANAANMVADDLVLIEKLSGRETV